MAKAPRKPLKIYLETGSMEDVSYNPTSTPTYGAGTVLSSTRHMRDVLFAKGYDLRYHEYAGLHRVLGWRGTFGDAVIFIAHRQK